MLNITISPWFRRVCFWLVAKAIEYSVVLPIHCPSVLFQHFLKHKRQDRNKTDPPTPVPTTPFVVRENTVHCEQGEHIPDKLLVSNSINLDTLKMSVLMQWFRTPLRGHTGLEQLSDL